MGQQPAIDAHWEVRALAATTGYRVQCAAGAGIREAGQSRGSGRPLGVTPMATTRTAVGQVAKIAWPMRGYTSPLGSQPKKCIRETPSLY
jgi:hypothetical protein